MKVSYQWLREYVDLADLSPEALADKLTSAGLAVDAVEPRNKGVSGVVVGEIVSARQHPDADRLRVCMVNVGTGEPLQIVCGAPNANPGLRVPVALPGATLPGGVQIRRTTLRGVESNGMLCSAAEIGLETRLLPSAQATGLFVLPEETPIGEDIVKVLCLDDVVLDIDLTPNRSDCFSIRGLVHEVAAILRSRHSFPECVEAPKGVGDSPIAIDLATERCPRYEAQVLDGINQTSSPLWMQMRLIAMGIRTIDLVVDVTNYVMLEWGQPLHAFDADSIAQSQIVVRQAHDGEELVTLDGQKRTLNRDMIVISDPEKAIGLAGVMGGENSEITASTRRIALESARFDGSSVRRTGQRLGLRSEAQQRFEKGVDPAAISPALARATALLVELGGARPIGPSVAVHQERQAGDSRQVPFVPEQCREALGFAISNDEMEAIFHALGFGVHRQEDKWLVEVPSRRADVALTADLYEEIARLHGYDNIPSTVTVLPVTPGMRDRRQAMLAKARELLVNMGMFEVRTYALTSPDALAPLSSPYRPIPLLLPMSDERRVLRTHLLPSLAEVAVHNLAHQVSGGAIFEIGKSYLTSELPLCAQPQEREVIAMLWFGETEGTLYEKARRYDFYDAKGVLENLLAALGADASYVRSAIPWLHPGRSADVVAGGETIGVVGELHPETAKVFGIDRAIYAEIDVASLLATREGDMQAKALPKFPGSRRDIAIVVDRETLVGDLLRTVRERLTTSGLLQGLKAFDVYVGEGVPEGKKSVAITMFFQDAERTLTDDEIEQLVATAIDALRVDHNAQLRS
ncbi:phenylalanine--tRNA ligase subunit beta [Alicyclobacillus hesperidum subsp. aegles]|uniref:phenylalanine--tRNA ligase subunit beta n=1 Tax=Alicyclobacillus hesperidum TaxID=89784 RepID=UPI00222D0951|nr:phenylalanine--tRNA ligase subunit beta [Alicyclobacillus hesperidum]GLG02194.1 phenylalanine--tRNA ligase subunit beta [Alicyclobacillus hesperidum subsp. aegles]